MGLAGTKFQIFLMASWGGRGAGGRRGIWVVVSIYGGIL